MKCIYNYVRLANVLLSLVIIYFQSIATLHSVSHLLLNMQRIVTAITQRTERAERLLWLSCRGFQTRGGNSLEDIISLQGIALNKCNAYYRKL